MSPFAIEIEAPNAPEVAEDFFAVAEHAGNLAPEFERVLEFLEFTEKRHFARTKGRYVDTSATIRSLTTRTGGDAIREAHAGALRFGSGVWYAKHLTKAPKDPNSGQVRKEPPGKGLSAVLVFSKTSQKKTAEMLMGYVAEPYG